MYVAVGLGFALHLELTIRVLGVLGLHLNRKLVGLLGPLVGIEHLDFEAAVAC